MPQFSTLIDHAQPVEEEIFDIRFEQIVSLVEQEKFDQAIPLIEVVLKEGRIDIRLVMYRFYAQFLDTGIKSLVEIFPTLTTIFEDKWEKLSPVKARDKHSQMSMNWFFSSIGKKLRRSEKLYREKRPDAFWKDSIQTLSIQDIEYLKDQTNTLYHCLAKRWDDSSIQQHLMFISKWLTGLESIIALHSDQTVQDNIEQVHEETKSDLAPALIESDKTSFKTTFFEEVLISSCLMKEFFNKIQTFEQLVEKQEFVKSALVADDIQKTIVDFNPAIFFPKLFSRYFSLIAQHIDILSQEWEHKTSLKWQFLHKLYLADLEEFMKW